MLNLDPGKLLVIGVVAIILLGPDRLPQVARQLGGAWRSFNEFRHRMESEVRNTMPDLPADLGDRPAGPLTVGLAQPPVEHVARADEEPDGSFQPPEPERRERQRRGGRRHVMRTEATDVPSDQRHRRKRDRRPCDAATKATATVAPAPCRRTNPAPATPRIARSHVERPPQAPKPSGVVVPGDPTLN